MSELSKSLGTMEFDGLIADINPKLVVSGGTIRKLSKADTIKRGTILAKSGGTAGDNKLVVLGTAAASNEVLTACCILCDDVDVGTADDVTAPVYLMGCFSSNKVLTEYMDGDRKMAAFVSPRVGAIPMERMGYEIHEFEPASIGVSRPLTSDDLTKRGFGEAIYANSTPAQRAAKLVQNDLADMDGRIIRTEEWMCAQTMLDNGCVMQEMLDNVTKGEAKVVNFYNPGHENDHIYTAAHKWNEEGGNFFGDVPAMCRLLSKRGLRAADLLLGADVYDAVMNLEKVQRLLDKNSGIIIGQIEQQLSAYDGVVYGGTINFRGYKLNLISVDETYVDSTDKEQSYFPKTDAVITAPGCGHLMYGAITQINYGDTIQSTISGRRVPKFSIDQENDTRKTALKSRPLAAPKNYIPWIRAKNMVG